MYTYSGTHNKSNEDKEKWFKSLLDAFKLKEEELPLVLITDPGSEQIKHVSVKIDIPIKDMTFENVLAYVNRFKNHEFRPFTQSEPKPDNEGKNIKIVVGSTYQDMINEGEILIAHTNDESRFSKMLTPRYIQLAEELKDVKGLKIAKFNHEKNSVAFLHIKSSPTLIYYSKTNKRGKEVTYSNRKGKMLLSLKAWLNENSKAYKKHDFSAEEKIEL